MPITETLVHNATFHGDEVALVEINPAIRETRGDNWRDYELVEANPAKRYRREITWRMFNNNANRFAHMLLNSGVGKQHKVAVLLMNCLEWLPVYFGVLKSGAVVVPMNYRYTADEIKYCLGLADCDTLVFGPEFVSRIQEIVDQIPTVSHLYYVGKDCIRRARRRADGCRRRRHLLLVRHDGLSEGHPA